MANVDLLLPRNHGSIDQGDGHFHCFSRLVAYRLLGDIGGEVAFILNASFNLEIACFFWSYSNFYYPHQGRLGYEPQVPFRMLAIKSS